MSRGTREEVTDPVCDMTFAAKKVVATTEYDGATYYFCTDACKKEFVRDPEQYVGHR